jgi:hypothetical protein
LRPFALLSTLETSDAALVHEWSFSALVVFLRAWIRLEFDAVRIVHQTVEDGMCNRRIANLRVPGDDGDLTGEQNGSRLVACITDLEEVAALGVSGAMTQSSTISTST